MDNLDADKELELATNSLNIDLAKLVAATTIWAPTELGLKHEPIKPKSRRGKRNEPRGSRDENNCYIDDNTDANNALKSALGGRTKFKNYAVCHVWEGTCYNPKYHTLLANLVLLPKAIAGLSDHNEHIVRCLKYRAWELFNWYPSEFTKPEKPENYPDNWRILLVLDCKITNPAGGKCQTNTTESNFEINLAPSPEEFKKLLIKHKKAKIEIVFSDGKNAETCFWHAGKINNESNILKNLQSKPRFRKENRILEGITRINVSIAME